MLGFLTLPVSAAEGTIQIQMPDELKGSAIHYHINGEPQCADIDENGNFAVVNGYCYGSFQTQGKYLGIDKIEGAPKDKNYKFGFYLKLKEVK